MDEKIAEARVLVNHLTGDVQRDAAFFRLTSVDHAEEILNALAARGMAQTASAGDWADLHRAFDALIELELFRGQLSKAAGFAGLNETYYRSHERDFEAALRSGRQALELQQKSGQTANIYLVLTSIGEDLAELGRTEEALESYRQARQFNPDPTSPSAAILSEDIVVALLARHARAAAEKECDDNDRLAESAPPVFQARALLTRSTLLFDQGNSSAAFDAIRKAQAIEVPREEAESLALEARAKVITGAIGAIYRLPNDQALALGQRLDREMPGMRFPLGTYARIVVHQRQRLAGDFDGLLREDAGRAEAAKAAGNVSGEIQALQSLALTYSAANGVRQQVVLLEEALRLEKATLPANGIPDSAASQSSYFRTLDSLGGAYLELRQADAARRCFDEVVKSIATLTPEVQSRLRMRHVEAVLGKARVLEMDDEPDDARAALLRILHDGNAVKNGFDRTEVLLQLARLERSLDEKPEAAVEYYEQAIAGYRESQASNPAALNQELAARLALTRYLTGKAASRVADARRKAEAHLLVVEQALPRLNYAEGEWRLNFLRGILAEASQPAAAIAFYRVAIGKLDAMRAGLTQQEQREGLLDNEAVQELYSRLISLLTRAGAREEAWQFLERGKARSFVEMLQGRRFRNGNAQPEVAELEKIEGQVANLRLQLAPGNVEVLRSVGREPEVMRVELKNLEARFAVARQREALNRSRAGQVLSLDPPRVIEIQKRIPPRTVLIEYALLDDAITAFVVTPVHIEQIYWKADLHALHRDVDRLRPLLEQADSTGFAPLVERLSAALIQPVSKALPAGTGRLLIVPAAYLNYLPFSALRLPDGRAVIDAYSTSYLPSASALLFLADSKKVNGDIFLGAIGNQPPVGMVPLPGTLVETADIAQVYPRARVMTGAKFTHDEARQALLHYDEVHFATHGELDEDTPLFSGLITSPAAGQPSRLSLYEITELSLKADMVVLSACRTGLGRLLGGDELTGLTRTFLTAGANTVVSSLWSVSDESTAMLMQGFYRRLRNGLTPAQALRESAMAVRVKYPHPHYWAPFVVTGR